MPRIYVTGHRNPDTDSVASAIGYAELKQRLDPANEYVPVRLGELNAQTTWVLARAGAPAPMPMAHILLRVRDVARGEFPTAGEYESVRRVGRTMADKGLDLVPIVDQDGVLVGVMTERALARRYIRESRAASRLEAPTRIASIVDVLDGQLLSGPAEAEIAGRVWVMASDVGEGTRVESGDVAVVGDRPDAQRRAIGLGVSLLVTSNGAKLDAELAEQAARAGIPIVVSDADSYVTARMITLAVPCHTLMDRNPLTVRVDDVIDDISDEIKDVHYRAAVAVDAEGRPVGVVTRSDLVDPTPRRVILVDHAEQAQSVPGIEQAEIVEILDHHHIGSIETRIPVAATFDPVGSTATLVIERFRLNGFEPSRPTAGALLGAILSDTVILNSPTTTDRDRDAISYLERVLALDALDFGREMFEQTSDLSSVEPRDVISRDAKEYELAGGGTLRIAQVETVGDGLRDRRDELLAALRSQSSEHGYALSALMLTDILARDTELLVVGDAAPLERAFGQRPQDGVLHLPGVMSRKKQVAPKLLRAAAG